MSNNVEQLRQLLQRFVDNQLTENEEEEFLFLLNQEEYRLPLEQIIDEKFMVSDIAGPSLSSNRLQEISNYILATNRGARVQRVQFLRRAWLRYAAAILLIAGAAVLAFLVFSDRASNLSDPANQVVANDILPGTNKAILTLSDGRKVELDSAAPTTINDGNLAIQNNNGELIYGKGEGSVMNTMATPNGGQYQLTLSDGTRVWLNAASSITYPTAFTGDNRQVKITGEAYLEVAKDKAHPFLVDVAGQSTVEVLGTSFNINSYADEGEIKTTLVEGSVKVGVNDHKVILKPGQQAVQPVDTAAVLAERQPNNAAGIFVKSDVDLSQTLAWKNGLFSFNNADLRLAMKQLERWYDIEVRYEREVSNINLEGKMYRNVRLSNVLTFFEEYGVKFRIDGKTLVVL